MVGIILGAYIGLLANHLVVSPPVYKYVDGNGHIYITNVPRHGGYKLLVPKGEYWTPPKEEYLPPRRKCPKTPVPGTSGYCLD